MLLLVSLGATMTMAYLGWSTSRAALLDSAFNELISIRSSKGAQIESFFENLANEARTLAEEESVISAMVHLNSEFKKLDRQMIQEEWTTDVDDYYTEIFFPELEIHLSGKPSLEYYRPIRPAQTYLQYHYIAQNEHPPKEKYNLDNAEDGSDYSRWHQRYHPFFHNVIERFGYYDIFLIDFDTNDVVYTVDKQVDFGTNLTTGPYSRSGLAEAVAAVHLDPQAGGVQVIDYQPYVPSYKAPAAFFATPIYNGPHIVGILALELPVDEVNHIMTGGGSWEADGLGRTGETYLVGQDLTMRSDSRFLIEDREEYLTELRKVGTDATVLESIEEFNTSIIYQPVDTPTSRGALTGQKGIQIVDDYRGHEVLSAYAPLQISGFDWGIVTDIELEEVMEPVVAQQNLFLITSAILIVLISLLAIGLSYYFLWPVNYLLNQTEQIKQGKFSEELTLQSTDEYGRLSRSINEIVSNLHDQGNTLENERRKNDNLLLNIVPQTIAERVKQGETEIVNQIPQATLCYAEIVGFKKLTQHSDNQNAVKKLNDLLRKIDEIAEKMGVEIRPLMGTLFIASCGITKPRLDHVKCMLEFVQKMDRSIKQFNDINDTELAFTIGIHTGPVAAGLIGGRRFRYDFWGEGIESARTIQELAEPGILLVSQTVYDQIHNIYMLHEYKNFQTASDNEPTYEGQIWSIDFSNTNDSNEPSANLNGVPDSIEPSHHDSANVIPSQRSSTTI